MSLRYSADLNGKKAIRTGLFAVKSRAYDKIQIRQKVVAEELEKTVWPPLKSFKAAVQLLDLVGNIMQWCEMATLVIPFNDLGSTLGFGLEATLSLLSIFDLASLRKFLPLCWCQSLSFLFGTSALFLKGWRQFSSSFCCLGFPLYFSP